MKKIKSKIMIHKDQKSNSIIEKEFLFTVSPDLEEDVIWRRYIAPLQPGIKKNVNDICHYGFTEILNNVIDHSNANKVKILYKSNLEIIEIAIIDDGVGIFIKITTELGLEDQREALLELTKGKLTTDPEHHTGEGIFFTTRMFDRFSIISGTLHYSYFKNDDWLLQDNGQNVIGTNISMAISLNSDRKIQDVFGKYTSDKDDFSFTRTHVPVLLAKYGEENLISRSQAKRLLARFDKFNEISLDFKGIDFIGQAFADEIFRVFKNKNPHIKITWFRTNANVEKMIKRVLTNT